LQAGAGVFMNIIAILCLTLAVNTWGMPLYKFGSVPDIFTMNVTTAA
jgi:hypothetical protein